MARQRSARKSQSRKLSVRKQSVKDLPTSRGKGPKGGQTTSSLSSPTVQALNFSSKFQKV